MRGHLIAALTLGLAGGGVVANVAAQVAPASKRAGARAAKPAAAERHAVRREFEAIFAKQVAEYKAQFEAVKRGEKLKPSCAPDFAVTRPDGSAVTCEQITADRQAKFERIKAINYLTIEIGNIELAGDEATVFTTQRFSRVVPGGDGRDRTVLTDGTVHKESWVRTAGGWRAKGFEEYKQGVVTVDGQPSRPPSR